MAQFEPWFIEEEPPGFGELRFHFIGTNTMLVSDGRSKLLFDAFFTDVPKSDLAFGELKPDRAMVARYLDSLGIKQILDAVIPCHAHHDHALDVGEVMKQTTAMLIGNAATLKMAQAYGLPQNRMYEAKVGGMVQLGDFVLRFFDGRHSCVKLPMGVVKCGDGALEGDFHWPAKIGDFKEGGSWSIYVEHPKGNFLIHGSPNYLPGAFEGYPVKPDAVFLATAGLGKQDAEFKETYYRELVGQFNVKKVVAIHWNDFTLSLDEDLQPFPYLVDDMTKTFEFMKGKEESDGIEVLLPRRGDRFGI